MTLSIQQRVSLRDRNTLAVNANARYLVEITEPEQIPEAIAFAHDQELSYMVLGEGSNIVFQSDYPGVVLAIRTRGVQFSESGDEVLVEVAAGENWHQLVMNCLQRGYYGIENLALIPGTAGAAPVQNIGAYGVELDTVLDSVYGWHVGEKSWKKLDCGACEFAYRDSIFKHSLRDKFVISAVTLRLSKTAQPHTEYAALSTYLSQHGSAQVTPEDVAEAVIAIRRSKLPDPKHIPNAGSFFKNPVISKASYEVLKQSYPTIVAYPVSDSEVKLAAGWLMERAGWKGVLQQGVGFHSEQALVLVNPGAVNGRAVMSIAESACRDVKRKFGVDLDIEPRIY